MRISIFKIDYDNWTISIIVYGKFCYYEEYTPDKYIFFTSRNLNIVAPVSFAKRNCPYNWVKFIYIDDPISSLDDNNAIGVASDLAKLLKKGKDKVKVVISSHHSLFYNVMYNELKKIANKSHFLHKNGSNGYVLMPTNETPFFHHVAILSELKRASETNSVNTYHFNMLRSILEKTSTFFGYDDFSNCINGIEDEVLFSRTLNLLSHGKYSIYQPMEMNQDNKELFNRILNAFLEKYEFRLPEIFV